MAGLFSLLYFATALGGSAIESTQESLEGKESYERAIINNSPVYMIGEDLYFTRTKEICHECINRKTGARQIRAGKKYGKGVILFDYGIEKEKKQKEYNKKYSEEQFNKAKMNQWKYYIDSEGMREVGNEKRYIVFGGEKYHGYYLQYLTKYKGKWYKDDSQPIIKISKEEWAERGGNTTHHYELLSNVIKKEKQELKRIEEIQKKKDIIKQEEQLRNEIQSNAIKSCSLICITCILILIFI